MPSWLYEQDDSVLLKKLPSSSTVTFICSIDFPKKVFLCYCYTIADKNKLYVAFIFFLNTIWSVCSIVKQGTMTRCYRQISKTVYASFIY